MYGCKRNDNQFHPSSFRPGNSVGCSEYPRQAISGPYAEEYSRCCFCLLFLVVLPFGGASRNGRHFGTVADSSGVVVPTASVRLENTGMQEVRTFIIKDTGEYVFTALQPYQRAEG